MLPRTAYCPGWNTKSTRSNPKSESCSLTAEICTSCPTDSWKLIADNSSFAGTGSAIASGYVTMMSGSCNPSPLTRNPSARVSAVRHSVRCICAASSTARLFWLCGKKKTLDSNDRRSLYMYCAASALSKITNKGLRN